MGDHTLKLSTDKSIDACYPAFSLMNTGLYIHIPFCVRKCLYCDFYSLETMRGPIADRLNAPQENRPEFMQALSLEFSLLPPDFRPTTIFIGGGTPTELSEHDLALLFKEIHQTIHVSDVQEWTCECNPGTLTKRKAALLKESGVTRVSLGAQSFDSANLEFLGRIHASGDIEVAVDLLRQTGFNNLNLDLIYGIPGSSLEKTKRDVQRALALNPEHLSCYCLTFEENTPLMGLKQKGFVLEVEDDIELSEYRAIRALIRDAGYAQYELSNFAKPGYACRHNLLYWGDGPYLGCGPSAHSHWKGRRYANVRHLRKYVRALLDDHKPALDFEEALPPEAKAKETLVMWLRRLEGVPRDAFQRATGFDYADIGGDALKDLTACGMLEENGNQLRLTEQGLFVSNSVFAELI
jgi:oxygen-independent coproporphyrinogen III oxidase